MRWRAIKGGGGGTEGKGAISSRILILFKCRFVGFFPPQVMAKIEYSTDYRISDVTSSVTV